MVESTGKKLNWFQRLKGGLKKSSDKITQDIKSILTHRRLDEETLQELEDTLILSDMGVDTAQALIADLRKNRFNQEITDVDVRQFLATAVAKRVTPFIKPLALESTHGPHVILMVGVNGSGKTTTIGKLGHQFKNQGLKVRLVAGDTFRAAAVEQLIAWGQRAQLPVEHHLLGTDPASLIFDAYTKSRQAQDNVLLIDTAGRLHNKDHLMAELAKIHRVLQKADSKAPHSCVLVLDAVLGQNVHAQIEAFQKVVPLTGLILTKLDGTAKGGVVIAVTQKFGLPLHAIGVGEDIEDLRDFNASDFAQNLLGLDHHFIA